MMNEIPPYDDEDVSSEEEHRAAGVSCLIALSMMVASAGIVAYALWVLYEHCFGK